MDKFNEGTDYKIVTGENSGTTGCTDNNTTVLRTEHGTFSTEHIIMNVFTFKNIYKFLVKHIRIYKV